MEFNSRLKKQIQHNSLLLSMQHLSFFLLIFDLWSWHRIYFFSVFNILFILVKTDLTDIARFKCTLLTLCFFCSFVLKKNGIDNVILPCNRHLYIVHYLKGYEMHEGIVFYNLAFSIECYNLFPVLYSSLCLLLMCMNPGYDNAAFFFYFYWISFILEKITCTSITIPGWLHICTTGMACLQL